MFYPLRPWYQHSMSQGPDVNMPADFALDPRLAEDTLLLGDLPLSRVLLMDEGRYPWLVLVPRRPGLVELTDLSAEEAPVLWGELHQCCAAMTGMGTKINVGALGNIVRQLHIHVIARHEGDPAWPGPVWGHSPRQPADPAERSRRVAEFRRALGF
ncbi:HIT family protein [Zavarzinia compransoris]|uniref:HIT domain-containing protein n=1 Tax=Zavarzinia marina TaxID=2911065 RepID=UPI001F4915AC|nr:HIT family protein [Zavarzinia marina]MCF4166541.1 HIT family protein [Zavarzinia marina]